jgi:hypothetical protein
MLCFLWIEMTRDDCSAVTPGILTSNVRSIQPVWLHGDLRAGKIILVIST